jgi:hypothetical protein
MSYMVGSKLDTLHSHGIFFRRGLEKSRNTQLRTSDTEKRVLHATRAEWLSASLDA